MNSLSALRDEARRLDAFTVFSSVRPPVVREQVAKALCPHKMDITASEMDASLARAAIGDVSMLRLRYGADTAVRPEALSQYVLLQFMLSGEAEVMFDGRTHHFRAGDAMILESLDARRLVWSADCEQLIVPVSRAALSSAAEMLGGDVAPRHFGFDTRFHLDDEAGRPLTGLVCYMLNQAVAGPAGREALGAPLASLLAHHLLINHSQVLRERGKPQAAIAPFYVRRAENFMIAHAEEDISLGLLADHAGVSVRTLTAGFRRYRGASPLERLRDIRLDRVRALLLEREAASVTEAALRLGFNHLGRFAAVYRERFGESPSATITRVQNMMLN